LHRARDAELVPLEIDQPVLALVPAAAPPHRDVPVVVAPARLLDRLEQRLLGRRPRNLGEIRDRAEARALRDRLELSNTHYPSSLEDLDRVARAELHDGLFPVRPTADRLADAPLLAAHVRRPH